MTARPRLRLRVWDSAAGRSAERPLPIDKASNDCTVTLRCLPGASGVHLVISDDHSVRLRAEIAAAPGETFPVRIEVDEHGDVHLSGRGRETFFLPVDDRYESLPALAPPSGDAPVDIAIVIDGTMRRWRENAAHVEALLLLVTEIVDGRQGRVAVLAFGDQEQPGVNARGLWPDYQILPQEDEQIFRESDIDDLRRHLLAIPATVGGDYVDALADALDACARLQWREEARKLAIVSGDSPGYSLVRPTPGNADICIRLHDVDTGAHRLHERGVEVLTIYDAPPVDHAIRGTAVSREMLAYTRDQYARLASLPAMSFEAASFDPASAAAIVRERTASIGRGMTLPEAV